MVPNVLITILGVLAGWCLPCGAICVYTSAEGDDAGKYYKRFWPGVAMLVFGISWIVFITVTEMSGGAYGL